MKFFFLTLALAASIGAYAQKEITASIFQSHVGLKSELSYSMPIKQNLLFTGGIQYLINQLIHDNRGFAFQHRFYAENFTAHWGASVGIERKFILSNSNIEPFAFFKTQATRSSIRTVTTYIENDYITFNADTVRFQSVSTRYLITMRQATSIENIIGGGFAVKVYKHIYLKAAVGLSTAFIYVPSTPTMLNNGGYRGIEFAGYYSGGLSYRFIKSKA
jgi:hypothetical protein